MLKGLEHWQYKNKAISRTFEFSSYLSGVKFVNKIASLAEELDHHPDMTLTWCKVHILLTTHDKGDVTEKEGAGFLNPDILFLTFEEVDRDATKVNIGETSVGVQMGNTSVISRQSNT